ncbi:uncharacterized protein LOC142527232 [Primulina tabacum]|uniref:uncharacterized protein LOC142527232 n=1 Tax=Primulina tabacum TaxID=48773 RepID=UPI003F59CCB5
MDSRPSERKGIVTPLSSLFPAEEAQKATKLVEETIAERKQQLSQLKGFINDNVNLINLVQKLPDEISHHIMVPFGKAAFFPGRLIHTNEFLVLLGEGYYADRTSKQTAEILKRRGKALETQVESLKAIMEDLMTEASFFGATASESAEGLVDIREDYQEEGSSETLHRAEDKSFTRFIEEDDTKAEVEDEEYARIFSRIAELEKEEEEAEKANEYEEDEQIPKVLDDSISPFSIDQVRSSQAQTPEVPPVSKGLDGSSRGSYPSVNSSVVSKASEVPEVKEKFQVPLTASNMAFTGSIVEHTHNIKTNSTADLAGAPSSKPVSRFKLQRK